jgi:hypothetical protein
MVTVARIPARPRGSAFPVWDGAFLWDALARQRLIAYDPKSARTSILPDGVGRVGDAAQLLDGDLVILFDVKDDPMSGFEIRVSPAKVARATRAVRGLVECAAEGSDDRLAKQAFV